MTKNKSKNEIAVIENNTQLAVADEFNDLMLQTAGQGVDDLGMEDVTIPFLRIIQDMSPEIDSTDAKYIPGAEKGDIFNTATQQVYRNGVYVIPVYFRRSYIEWTPRNKGGGFVKDHGLDSSCLNDCEKSQVNGAMVNKAGNEIVETRTYYVYVVDPATGSYEQAVIAFSSTGNKPAKDLGNLIKSLTININGVPKNPAIYAGVYKFTTVRQQNDKGKWYNWAVERAGLTPNLPGGRGIVESAAAFRELIAQGAVKLQTIDAEVAGDRSLDAEVL